MCIFCGNNPDAFICAKCSNIFINASLESIKLLYDLAVEKGYIDKAKALEQFIQEEEDNRQLKPSRFDRKANATTKKFKRPKDRKVDRFKKNRFG